MADNDVLHMSLINRDAVPVFSVQPTREMMQQFFSATANTRLHQAAAVACDREWRQLDSRRMLPSADGSDGALFSVKPDVEAIKRFLNAEENARMLAESAKKHAKILEDRNAALRAAPPIVGHTSAEFRKFFRIPAAEVPRPHAPQPEASAHELEDKVKSMRHHPEFMTFLEQHAGWDMGEDPNPTVEGILAGEPEMILDDFAEYLSRSKNANANDKAPGSQGATLHQRSWFAC